MRSRKRKRLFKIAALGGAVLVLVILASWLYLFLPFWGIPFNGSRHTGVPLTPAWALECWLWEDDVNTAQAVLDLVEGYEKCDFPVRTILIDSPWSTRYNDFIVDEERYPDPAAFFTGLQDRGYRVVLWMTCMVNSKNDDTAIRDATDWHQQEIDEGYLAGEGYQTHTGVADVRACTDCLVAFTDSEGLYMVMPGMEGGLWVKDVKKIEIQ